MRIVTGDAGAEGIREIGCFVCFFVEIILGVLGCIDFAKNLSKNMMWHVFIGWYKPKGLHHVLTKFNFLDKIINLEDLNH